MIGKGRVSLLSLALFIVSAPALAGSFVAFSLREAQRQARLGLESEALHRLGGMTRIIGAVYDLESEDVILVGRIVDVLPECTLDDLVVALRARLVLGEWPTVSIDPTSDTPATGRQAVTFQGGLGGTRFGAAFLESDVVLKNYSLGLLPPVSRVKSYRDLVSESLWRSVESPEEPLVPFTWLSTKEAVTAYEKLYGQPVSGEDACQMQFWFYAREPFHVHNREGVFCIERLDLIVRFRVLTTAQTMKTDSPEPSALVRAAERFAEQFGTNLSEVTRAYPVLKRLKILLDLVAVSEGIRETGSCVDLDYFLSRYPVAAPGTSKEHELVDLLGTASRPTGGYHFVRITGGIRFETELKWLNDGDVTPLRKVVIHTRPGLDALWWTLPLEGWDVPNAADLAQESSARERVMAVDRSQRVDGKGFTLGVQAVVLGSGRRALEGQRWKPFAGLPPLPDAPSPLGGVSMRMNVLDDSFRRAPDGSLAQLRRQLLDARPSTDKLAWPAPKGEKADSDEEKDDDNRR